MWRESSLLAPMPAPDSIRRFLIFAGFLAAGGWFCLTPVALARSDFSISSQTKHPESQGSLKREAQIECLAPGKAGPISLTLTDAKIRYALPGGTTSFIIHLAATDRRRCFTLVNENRMAEGKLSIAIANERLAANDPKWSAVEGAIPFRHKRLFALSLIGVEAKFVKLTFLVHAPKKITRRDEATESRRPRTGSETRLSDRLGRSAILQP